MPGLDSLLIANRGEIAVRIARTARELGIRTVAVYSEADRHGLHPEFADEARFIGGAHATDSYLNQDAIIAAARDAGVDAVHPGYGFLSENGAFARAVEEAGLIWVGPPADAIELMGDKLAARRTAEQARARPVPGMLDPVISPDEVTAFIREFGLPVLIKASGGGGGRGMRLIRAGDDVTATFNSAAREAAAAFSNPELYVERFLVRPRHIEAQIACDAHGNGVFYGERDCSTQRRNQKLIEEAPAIGLEIGVREVIAERALAIAAGCNYRSVGTVEFLVTDEEVYFLEMNTRLQVEHPVTELVTGIDLVAEQIRIATGEPLEPGHRAVRGHAIEFRINAEDPGDDFRPDPGKITRYREPGGPGVRVDSGVREGSVVPDAYDNLIAKLIVTAASRPEAIRRGHRALGEYQIGGIGTTIAAHEAILEHGAFAAGTMHTQLVESEISFPPTDRAARDGMEPEHRTLRVEVGGRLHHVDVWVPGGSHRNRRPPPMPATSNVTQKDDGTIRAPIQGTIAAVEVEIGQRVAAGDVVCILEAMKMENEIPSPVAGIVDRIEVSTRQTVPVGHVLAVITPDPSV